jgi:hypothetical protein
MHDMFTETSLMDSTYIQTNLARVVARPSFSSAACTGNPLAPSPGCMFKEHTPL